MSNRRQKTIAASASRASSEVDLTPMLDVVFILLIFFVVTASFVSETTLQSDALQPSELQGKAQAPTLVTISEDNQIHIDNREVERKALKSVLASKQAEASEARAVIIRAHVQAQTNTYVWVLDAAQQVGASSILMEAVES